MASPEFAEAYTNALPGFFALADAEFEVTDPLAQEFLAFRDECESTIRVAHQILSRGEPNTWNNLWTASANDINEAQTPRGGGRARPVGAGGLVRAAAGLTRPGRRARPTRGMRAGHRARRRARRWPTRGRTKPGRSG